MNQILEVEVRVQDDTLTIEVLNQHECLRSLGVIEEIENELALASYEFPELQRKRLCIRGRNKSMDNEKSSRRYNSSDEALETVKSIEKIVNKIGGNVKVILEK